MSDTATTTDSSLQTDNTQTSSPMGVTLITALAGLGIGISNAVAQNKVVEQQELALASEYEQTDQARLDSESKMVGGIPVSLIYVLVGVVVLLVVLGIVFKK